MLYDSMRGAMMNPSLILSDSPLIIKGESAFMLMLRVSKIFKTADDSLR